jgi:hypothetical protein
VILYFPNYESACLAVTKLRDEGHFAEVCDVACSSIYGAAAIGGVRVIASDEPIPEDLEETSQEIESEPDPDVEPEPPSVLEDIGNMVRGVVFALGMLVPLAMTVALISFFINKPFTVASLLLGLALFLVFVTVMSMYVPSLLRRHVIVEPDQHRSVVASIVLILFIIFIGLAIASLT